MRSWWNVFIFSIANVHCHNSLHFHASHTTLKRSQIAREDAERRGGILYALKNAERLAAVLDTHRLVTTPNCHANEQKTAQPLSRTRPIAGCGLSHYVISQTCLVSSRRNCHLHQQPNLQAIQTSGQSNLTMAVSNYVPFPLVVPGGISK